MFIKFCEIYPMCSACHNVWCGVIDYRLCVTNQFRVGWTDWHLLVHICRFSLNVFQKSGYVLNPILQLEALAMNHALLMVTIYFITQLIFLSFPFLKSSFHNLQNNGCSICIDIKMCHAINNTSLTCSCICTLPSRSNL